jgi:transposase
VVLIDESGFMLQPLVRRTWAPIGQTPVLDQWDRHDRTSVITALALSRQRRRVRMFFRLLDHNATADDFIWFLNDVRLELGRKLHVVWDSLGAHRKAENFFRTISWPWARFHRLPAYAPELNPVEHVWTTAKWGRLANAPPDGLDQMRDTVQLELSRQANEQQLLKAHFRWAGLDLS